MRKTPIALAVLSACSLSMAIAAGSALAAGDYGSRSGSSDSMSGGSAVQSGGSGAGLERSFLELDTNLDGVISQEEASQSDVLDQRYSEADANQDGAIDNAEFSAFETELGAADQPGLAGDGAGDAGMGTNGGAVSDPMGSTDQGAVSEQAELRFSDLDLNSDGEISKEEAVSAAELAQKFDSADSDASGSISQSEFSAFEADIGAGQESMQQQGMGADQGMMGGQQDQLPSFTELDADTDGQLTELEAQNHDMLSQRFSEADVNQDGYVSRSEFSAFETEIGTQPQYESQPGMQPGTDVPDGGTMDSAPSRME